MSAELLINVGLAETRTALVVDGRLRELEIWRADEDALPGAIYLGRVDGLAPGLQAAFVALGLERPGLLAARDLGPPAREARDAPIARRLQQGQAVLVQVRRAPADGKGAVLRMTPTLPGRALAFRPQGRGWALSRRIAGTEERARLAAVGARLVEAGGGFVLRTAAAGTAAAALEGEAAALRRLWHEIEARAAAATAPARLHADDDAVARALCEYLDDTVTTVRLDQAAALGRARAWCRCWAPWAEARLALHDGAAALFEQYGVEAEIEAALETRVPLAGGGWLAIEATEALTAIDVNSGAGSDGRDPEATALACNLEAAAEVARQLRLREIGGLVVVDFLRMAEAGSAARVLAALDAALAEDPSPTRRTAFSGFGLVEMTRRRRRPSLAERLGGWQLGPGGRIWRPSARAQAEALLRRAQAEARARPGGALVLRAAPAVIETLARLPGLGPAALSRALGCRVGLAAEPERALRAIEVTPAARKRDGRCRA